MEIWDKTLLPWRLTYTGMALDRASALRPSLEKIENMETCTEARVLPVWDGQHFFAAKTGEAQWIRGNDAEKLVDKRLGLIFLGIADKTPWFALPLISECPPPSLELKGTFEALHSRVGLLDADQAALLAYARGMVLWHLNHLHCGRCGVATDSRDGGHIRLCTDVQCGHRTFPRTDSAVITLVVHPNGDKCLLGRQSRWPVGMYSVVAGFVEPGESLEECVQREVKEETGIETTNVQYVASQPWPFPSSLMLGFTAQAQNVDFNPDDDELDDILWVTKSELASYGEMGDDSPGPKLPNGYSIARMLIERWRTSEA
jgi:NAD+ diphosphatase